MNVEENHDAIVTDNQDPEKRGRVKVTCVSLMGDDDADFPEWIEPALDWGHFSIPDVGEIIEISFFTSGDTDDSYAQTSLENPLARWHGVRYYTDKSAETEVREPHPDFLVNYGKRRGYATPAGHIWFFDDTEDKTRFQLTWVQGDDKKATIEINEDGNIVLTDAHGSVITMEDGKITMEVDTIDLKAATAINLMDGADDKAVRGNDLISYINGHTHPTAMGASSTPTVPAIATDFLSTKVSLS